MAIHAMEKSIIFSSPRVRNRENRRLYLSRKQGGYRSIQGDFLLRKKLVKIPFFDANSLDDNQST